MNVLDCFQDLRDWKVKAIVGSTVNVDFLVRYTFCASDASEDFSPGPVDGSSFSLHRNPLGNPSPTLAWTHSKCKVFRRLLPCFTVNPGEGVLCQLMPDSLCEWWQYRKKKVLTCVQSSSALCSFLVSYRWEIRKETKKF